MHDNLMLVGGVIASGGLLATLIAERVDHRAEHYTSLVAFQRGDKTLARWLLR